MTDLVQIVTDLIGWNELLFLIVGLSIGILVGSLPGVGPLLGVIMAIPFTYYADPVPAMALLIGIYQGGSYGGAVAATMIGIPGTPMAAATMLDARPMALSGRASEAVTLSTIGSTFGGVVSALVLIAVAPQLAAIALRFGPAETAAFALLGLTALGALSGGSPIKGWAMGFLGLFIATIGLDPVSGVQRFTFGSTYLDAGVTLVPLLVGLFSISEVLMQVERPVQASDTETGAAASAKAFASLVSRPFNYLRSSLSRCFCRNYSRHWWRYGVIPELPDGIVIPKEKDPDFGEGNPDGVIASETANSAVTGGALIPMMSLSIPGDPIVAVLMGGLMLQGVQPGPQLFLQNADVAQGIFLIFLIGAILLLPLGLVFIRGVVRLLRLPQWIIMTSVLMISLVGTYSVARQINDLWLLIFFGLLGYILRKADYPLAPLVIGFVLGPIFESNFRRTVLISQGDLLPYVLSRPITLSVLVCVVGILFVPLLRRAIQSKSKQCN